MFIANYNKFNANILSKKKIEKLKNSVTNIKYGINVKQENNRRYHKNCYKTKCQHFFALVV